MLTGVYPHTHGLRTNSNSSKLWPTREISTDVPLITQQLNDAGYRCGYSGKWHCGEELLPCHYGFEGMDVPGYGIPYAAAEYEEYLASRKLQIPHAFLAKGNKNMTAGDVPQSIQIMPGVAWAGGTLPGPPEACEPAFVVSHAIDLLDRYSHSRREDGRPFFQVVSFWGPHHPYYIPEPYASMYDPNDVELWPSFRDTLEGKPNAHDRHRRSFYHEHVRFSEHDWRRLIAKYWGYCSFIDAEVGRLLSKLEELGMADETAVFFTTDHGDMTGAHGGLFDKGAFMYEETYHIPLITRVPGMTQPGTISGALVSNMDLASTILDVAGLTVPDEHHGRSLVPPLRDPDVPVREELMCEFHGLRVSYHQRMLRWQQYKYVYNAPDIDELYDLGDDPLELHNRINDESLRSVADQCRQRLLECMRSSSDVIMGSAYQHLRFGFDGSTSACVPAPGADS
jgi:arylsulfatase A-like enzyme